MWSKKRKTCNTKVLTTEYDDDDLIQSDNDQHTNYADGIVDTDTVTDMSETINRDHSEECEEKKEKLVTQKF